MDDIGYIWEKGLLVEFTTWITVNKNGYKTANQKRIGCKNLLLSATNLLESSFVCKKNLNSWIQNDFKVKENQNRTKLELILKLTRTEL